MYLGRDGKGTIKYSIRGQNADRKQLIQTGWREPACFQDRQIAGPLRNPFNNSYLPKLLTAAMSLSYTSNTVISFVTCSTSLNFAPRLQSLSVPPCDRAL